MSLGMIVRADDGGLGNLTAEIAAHVHPDKVLIVDVHPRRGGWHPERYDGIEQLIVEMPVGDGMDFLDTDVVFSCETFYDASLVAHADLRLLAMPELLSGRVRNLHMHDRVRLFAPTPWEQPEGSTLLLVPVNTQRLPFMLRDHVAENFLHVTGPAMCDRNGTLLVQQACDVYDGPPITLFVGGPDQPDGCYETRGGVSIVPLWRIDDYWDLYHHELDVLFQPRRYGGLSLIHQEARAVGMPALTLGRYPEVMWPGTLSVAPTIEQQVRMKGGRFPVYTTDPRALAVAMRDLATDDDLMLRLSAAAGAWGTDNSWDVLGVEWCNALR